MWPWAMTLTLDFEGQILKTLYNRNKRWVVQDSHEGRLKEAWLAEDGSLGIC